MKLEKATLKVLENYSWPGNVRELENLIERAWVLSGNGKITVDLIEPWLKNTSSAPTLKARPGHILEDTEKELIMKTLQQFNGHRAKTAKALGIGLRTLGLKLKRWQDEGLSLMAS